MKRKMIERIPYITVKNEPEEEAAYIMAAGVREAGGEDHIFLELYRTGGSMETPEVRYAATKRDWGIYWPETGAWSRESINSMPGSLSIRGKCAFSSEEGICLIKKFFGKSSGTGGHSDDWRAYFGENENLIRQDERNRKYRRRIELLEKRQEATPDLGEKKLLEWAERTLFGNSHILYYKKKRSHASLLCSKCGGMSRGRWKDGESYESSIETRIEEPRERFHGRCPLCGAFGEYVPQGRAGRARRKSACVFRVDRYQEEGAVARYIELEIECRLEMAAGEYGGEMTGADEKLTAAEISRTYFLPGKRPQTDYHKQNNWDGKSFWDDCNLQGLESIRIKEGIIHPDTWENLKETYLRYSAMKEYAESRNGILNVKDYLENYHHVPQIEMLVKLGLISIVDRLVRYEYGIVYTLDAGRPDLMLGIRKEHLKLLREHSGDIGILKTLQLEKRMNQRWNSGQIEALKEAEVDQEGLSGVLKRMPVQKFLNYISKQAGCEYGTGCHEAEIRLKMTAGMYFDYLHMREALGYDMENMIYLKPRSLRAAHDKMVLEQNDREAEERVKQTEEKYPDIRKRYRSLRKRYFYQAEGLQIRPARSAEEIVMEGRLLHHCVGGDNYLQRHNSGRSIILFLRDEAAPDVPYVTAEIQETRIVQWYGAYDKKTDEAKINKWMGAYVTWLKCRDKPVSAQDGRAAGA